jgi:hypothetical protein
VAQSVQRLAMGWTVRRGGYFSRKLLDNKLDTCKNQRPSRGQLNDKNNIYVTKSSVKIIKMLLPQLDGKYWGGEEKPQINVWLINGVLVSVERGVWTLAHKSVPSMFWIKRDVNNK